MPAEEKMKKSKILITSLLSLICYLNIALSENNELVIYTYDSFSSEWGPGPAIESKFEESCECDIQFVSTSSAATLMTKILLEGSNTDADIVIGLDQNFLFEAKESGLFADHKSNLNNLNIEWTDTTLIPYDYGYFSFIYNDEILNNPPESLAELVSRKDINIVVQDPRTSTPGLGLLLWIKSIYGKRSSEVWEELNKKIVTYTPGWSESYGMFLENEADMVLSYTTSPTYHQMYEGEKKYKSANFTEGHYSQIELAGVIKSSNNPKLARKFLNFLISDDAQIEMPTKNVMFPVINLGEKLPEEFKNINTPNIDLTLPSKNVSLNKTIWIDEWLNAASK
jgi:thiamine transport system substrate-binding protein